MRTCKMCLRKKKIYIQKIRTRETLELNSIAIVKNNSSTGDTNGKVNNQANRKVFPCVENTNGTPYSPIEEENCDRNLNDLDQSNITVSAVQNMIEPTSEVWFRLVMYGPNVCLSPAVRNGPNGSLVVPGKSLSEVLEEYASF